jgi:hypothetical protein
MVLAQGPPGAPPLTSAPERPPGPATSKGRIATRTREIHGHRLKQVDLVVEGFQLLGGRLALAA